MRQTILTLLCLAMIVAYPRLAAADDDDAPKPKHPKEWATYEDKEHGFQIDFPGEWESKKSISEAVIGLFVSPAAPEGRSADVVTVSYAKEKAPQDLDKLLVGELKALKEQVRDFKLVEKGFARVDGHEARRMVYTGRGENDIEIENVTLMISLHDGRFFSISIVSDPQRHDAFRKTAERIFDSFKVLKMKPAEDKG